MRYLFVAIGLISIVFLLIDDPINSVRQLTNESEEENSNFRQSTTGLALFLSRDGSREGRRVAAVLQDWIYCYPETGEVFIVPKGYETDFASIPTGARVIISPFGRHAEASVIHDWLYAVGQPKMREHADKIFRYAMEEQKVNMARRNAMYWAVRWGGEEPYGSDEEWRFVDTHTLEASDPPFPRPERASVTKINCADLDSKVDELLIEFGSEKERF